MIGPNASAEEQHDEDQQTQRRNGSSGIAEADHQERTTIGVTDEDAEWYRDSRCYRQPTPRYSRCC